MFDPSTISVHCSLAVRNSSSWVPRAMAVLFLLSAAQSSHAAGCHVQDRPIAHFTISWDDPQKVGLAARLFVPASGAKATHS
jgi:hypothetical protein